MHGTCIKIIAVVVTHQKTPVVPIPHTTVAVENPTQWRHRSPVTLYIRQKVQKVFPDQQPRRYRRQAFSHSCRALLRQGQVMGIIVTVQYAYPVGADCQDSV